MIASFSGHLLFAFAVWNGTPYLANALLDSAQESKGLKFRCYCPTNGAYFPMDALHLPHALLPLHGVSDLT